MSRVLRETCESGIYHVILRGVGQMVLFERKCDAKTFLTILSKAKEKYSIEIYAYCLMENHVHLLIRDKLVKLSECMHMVGENYAIYFNTVNDRIGHVFQDRFFSKPVNDELQLMTVFRYIINNPVKAGYANREAFPWSSYADYKGRRGLTDIEMITSLIGNIEDIDRFLDKEESVNEMELEYGARHRLTGKDVQNVIETVLNSRSGTDVNKLSKIERNKKIREMHLRGLTFNQIARHTGLSRSTIARVVEQK